MTVALARWCAGYARVRCGAALPERDVAGTRSVERRAPARLAWVHRSGVLSVAANYVLGATYCFR